MQNLRNILLTCLVILQAHLDAYDTNHSPHKHECECMEPECMEPFVNLTTQQDLSFADHGILFRAPITFETLNPLNNNRYFDTSSAPVDGSVKILKPAIYEIDFTVEAFALFRDLLGLHPTPSWGIAPQIIRRSVPQPLAASQVFGSPGIVLVFPPTSLPLPTTFTSSIDGQVIVRLRRGDKIRLINASNNDTNEIFLVSFPGFTSGQTTIPATNSATLTIKLLSEK